MACIGPAQPFLPAHPPHETLARGAPHGVFKLLIFCRRDQRNHRRSTWSAVLFVSLEINGEHSLESFLRQPAARRRFIGGGRSSRQGGGSVDDEADGGGSDGVGEGRKIGSVAVEEEH